MDTEGTLRPETAADAQAEYAALESTASEVVRAVTKAMAFDGDEYDERVTDDVFETAQDALFASQLAVSVGTREEFEQWREETGYDVTKVGSDNVENVAWHGAPAADGAVAATFQNEPEAAVQTLRRQAFGQLYREIVKQ
ncbi:DUF5809 family protein [Halovenus halobia]|uniref:DUF5809 family protein n=1 Tax=Halovenus halobia TaxID=3396622 RepID=UPI003F55A3C2